MKKTSPTAEARAGEIGAVAVQLAALQSMAVSELAEWYLRLYGEPTRSRNRDYLRKRLAFRIQENAEGGLSKGALERIRELGDQLPERWRIRQSQARLRAAAVVAALEPRDPRVPPVGTVLRRVFEGTMHEVTVCPEGFEYAGRRYRTLSAVAMQIAGTRWNGFLFFGLKKPLSAAPKDVAA